MTKARVEHASRLQARFKWSPTRQTPLCLPNPSSLPYRRIQKLALAGGLCKHILTLR